MYKGGLVTFKIRNQETLVALSLLDVEIIEITDQGILLKNKRTDKALGYFENVIGIDFNEMMNILGYEYVE